MSDLLRNVLKTALTEGKVTPQEVFAEIEDELRKVRLSIFTAKYRADGYFSNAEQQGHLKSKIKTVVDILDKLLPPDPQGATLFTENTRTADDFTAKFVATSDGKVFDIDRIRWLLRREAPKVSAALMLASVAKWPKAKNLRKLDEALEHAVVIAEGTRPF